MLKELRWHGRGGQGCVTASELLAKAVIGEGGWAQAIPSFGPERRGAPVSAFNRISDEEIHVRSGVNEPDVLVVLDQSLLNLEGITDGLKPDGIVIVNSKQTPEVIRSQIKCVGKLALVDASGIALQEIGVSIANTAILGAVAKATNLVSIDAVAGVIRERFPGRIGEKNAAAARRAFEETRLS
ncbi:MAG TPA: 2-oxoacid:acceptor oxidoreductase family protein [Candidatus Bathyarchaeia archaeon]|nr:2-oxoacid:acceptor oxidoreductase family protein [Candidatus Bathyarchaeia archaeon]